MIPRLHQTKPAGDDWTIFEANRGYCLQFLVGKIITEQMFSNHRTIQLQLNIPLLGVINRNQGNPIARVHILKQGALEFLRHPPTACGGRECMTALTGMGVRSRLGTSFLRASSQPKVTDKGKKRRKRGREAEGEEDNGEQIKDD